MKNLKKFQVFALTQEEQKNVSGAGFGGTKVYSHTICTYPAGGNGVYSLSSENCVDVYVMMYY